MTDSIPDLTMICGIERAPRSHIPVLHNAVSTVWNNAVHGGDHERSKFPTQNLGKSEIFGVD